MTKLRPKEGKMINLLAGTTEIFFVGFIPFIFIAVFIAVTVSAAKKSGANSDARNSYGKSTDIFNTEEHTDGNGLTQSQRDYLNGLRVKAAEKRIAEKDSAARKADNIPYAPKQEATHRHVGNTIVANSDEHTHVGGTEEYYDVDYGSLGDVKGEGCDDLNGVRIIAHDLAYEPKEGNRDYSQVTKALVLGEILNSPRFKTISRREVKK